MLEALPQPKVDHIRTTALRSSFDGYVTSLVRPSSLDVRLDGNGQASSVRMSGSSWAPATLVSPSTPIVDAARRSMARSFEHRFAPLVCTDGQGQVLGVVAVDDLMLALCTSSPTAGGR